MKHYDKIFFLVSLVVLGSSLGFYFMNAPEKSGAGADVDALLAKKAKGIKWNKIAVPDFKPTQIEWPEVRAQDAEGKWFFQVFTPPQIWIDRDGVFQTESPYYKEVARQNFALKFGGVSNDPYNVKFVGVYGDEKSPRVQFLDTATNKYFTGKLNKEIFIDDPKPGNETNKIATGLTMKSFKKSRIKNKENNTITNVYTVVLNDKNIGRDVTVYSNKDTIINDQLRMTLILPDGGEWFVKKAGAAKTVGQNTYTVKELNLKDGFAIVEMTSSVEGAKPQLMRMSADGVENVK